MKETLLIIVLLVAVVFDIVRIAQYVKLRSQVNKKNESDIEIKNRIRDRIDLLYYRWYYDKDAPDNFGDYVVEHYDDDAE